MTKTKKATKTTRKGYNKDARTENAEYVIKYITSGAPFTIADLARDLGYTYRGTKLVVNRVTKELKLRGKLRKTTTYVGPRCAPATEFRYVP